MFLTRLIIFKSTEKAKLFQLPIKPVKSINLLENKLTN